MRSMILILLAGFLLNGCASMSRQRDEEAVKKVKSVAVVAFIVKEPASNVMELNIGSGSSGAAMGGSSFYQNSAVTDAMYADLTKSLKKATGWKVLSQAEVTANPNYKTLHDTGMGPIKIMNLPKQGENWYMAQNVMVPAAAEMLGRDGRNKLLAALDVDAVVVATVDVSVSGGFSLNGFGPRKPKSDFVMEVYRRDQKDPIWRESIDGEKSKESLGWIGFIDEDRLKTLARKSSLTAFERINTEIK